MDNNENRSFRSGAKRRLQAPKPKRHLFKKITLSVITVLLVLLVLGTGLFIYYASSAPKIDYNSLTSDNSTKIYDNRGKIISRLGAQNRDYVSSKQTPRQLKSAVVSIEDRHFYTDQGVDPARIVEAAFSDVFHSSNIQGGSTLTQQLVKLSVFSTAASDRTIKRKAQEAWLALKIDHQYSKQKILEFYINKVYMGNNIYGMQTAAEYYYGKPLSKLNLAETATLAGMPQSPTLYNPYVYPKYAQERRNQVLSAMVQNKQISQQEANQAANTNIKANLAKSHHNTDTFSVNEKYIDGYLKQVIQELNEKGYNTHSGAKVYTNLNLNNQKHLYKLANGHDISFPNNKFQVGATMVNAHNGKVTAMLGGRKVKVPFGTNRAVQTDRSNGSTMKPLMDYGPAIQYLKYPTYQPVYDTPYTYPGTDISLHDFDNRYEGIITMRKAIVESRNIPAIRTAVNVGIPRATDFLSRLGLRFNKQLEIQNGIGAYISSEQEAAAYAAFANGGTYYKPYLVNKVVTSDNKVHNYSSNGKRAMSRATAFMLTDMMKGVMNSSNGSGTAAKVSGLNEAGKTGTTQYPNNYLDKFAGYASMDSWFTGYTKNMAMSIWTGYDHPFQAGHDVTAEQTNIAQELYKYEMEYASVGQPNEDWTKPSDVGEINKNGHPEYYIEGHSNISGDVTHNGDLTSNKKYNLSLNGSDSSSESSSSSSSTNTNSESSSAKSDKDSDNDTNNSSGSTSSDIDHSSSGSGSSGSSNDNSSSSQPSQSSSSQLSSSSNQSSSSSSSSNNQS
ncbi:penicillin-binding protein 1A [Philodulcilactobacillus myokoensis]|uniref:Penicillin-binding protein 1A n=1 Tax=Philodulcilactobacillus myokoensis TaxID=2929573 RepID=A0A9W6B2B8_9LACO|nr:transglycosylase domain-containing protein [Philodulcilactobacillus myokoensis]GLB46844.1 penicillin-binding protein 1A [Philodulcilactobacillus myokoensis]